MKDNLSKYYTPEWAVKGMLEVLPEIFPSYEDMEKFEPFCGDGAISRLLTGDTVMTNDIDPDAGGKYFLDMNYQKNWVSAKHALQSHNSIVITNPPFPNSAFYVEQALKYFGNVVMLLRLSWLEPTQARRELPLPDHMLITNRISFKGKGTDSVTTAWFIWQKEYTGQKSIIRHILKPE